MPYASEAQRRFFHTDTARKHGITAADVHEWDRASEGKRLPERAEKRANRRPVAGAPFPPSPPPFPTAQRRDPNTTPGAVTPLTLSGAVGASGLQGAVAASQGVFSNTKSDPIT